MTTPQFSLAYQHYRSLDALPSNLQILWRAAQDACELAYAPYSKFQVGAAFLLHQAGIVQGANQENAAYPSGLCAERTAGFYISAHHKDDVIEVIAVTARPSNSTEFVPVTPCGACRQALLEFEIRQSRAIKMLFQLQDGTFALIPSINSLLPFAFNDSSLKAS